MGAKNNVIAVTTFPLGGTKSQPKRPRTQARVWGGHAWCAVRAIPGGWLHTTALGQSAWSFIASPWIDYILAGLLRPTPCQPSHTQWLRKPIKRFSFSCFPEPNSPQDGMEDLGGGYFTTDHTDKLKSGQSTYTIILSPGDFMGTKLLFPRFLASCCRWLFSGSCHQQQTKNGSAERGDKSEWGFKAVVREIAQLSANIISTFLIITKTQSNYFPNLRTLVAWVTCIWAPGSVHLRLKRLKGGFIIIPPPTCQNPSGIILFYILGLEPRADRQSSIKIHFIQLSGTFSGSHNT